jgi:hypothetical protein
MEQFHMSERKMLKIGCKLPSGLRLEIGKPHDSNYRFVELKGANSGNYTGRPESGRIFVPNTVHGFGVTEVDSELWAEWKRTYKVNAARWEKEGVLFVVEDDASVKAAAADGANVKTGFEQLNPDKMPGGLTKLTALPA